MSLSHLPLFPLPVVLFPGTTLPLHVFEQRYRSLLRDCLDGDRRFGIIALHEGGEEQSISPGAVGCVAHIEESEALPDGRSNILVRGTIRFELVAIVASPAPYLVGRVTEYVDDPDTGSGLELLAAHIRDVFLRVAKAARALADDPNPVPRLPDEPELLSFAIASMIDLDLNARQQLLVSDSPRERLERLDAVLLPALDTLGIRAHVHTLAKLNGQGAHLQT